MLKEIMRALIACATVAVMLQLASCAPATSGIATEAEICRQWRDTLILPSRQDTQETAEGLTRQGWVLAAVCSGQPR